MQYADDRVSGQSTYNTAVGNYALSGSTIAANNTGQYNTAVGDQALYDNTSGNYNSTLGYISLSNITTGGYNTAMGYSAFSTGSSYTNSTALGYNAEPVTSNRIMLGNSSVTWIGGHSSWNNTSDERMKNNIQEDVKGLDFIMELRPVTYYFDKDKIDNLIGTVDSSDYPEKYDIEKIKQSGFLAQEVEQAAQKSGYDFSGVSKSKGDVKYYSLAYAEFVVPLVKAVQEQQQIIEKQNSTIEILIKRLEVLENSKKQIKR